MADTNRKLTPMARLELPHGATLVLAAGSILDYEGDAFVNAANEGCVAGFGLDEMVNRSGGPRLKAARKKLGACWSVGGSGSAPQKRSNEAARWTPCLCLFVGRAAARAQRS